MLELLESLKMTIYIRNDKNETLVECDIWESEDEGIVVTSVVTIDTYSRFLLANLDRSTEIINSFEFLSDLCGLYYNVFLEQIEHPTYEETYKHFSKLIKDVCEDFDLRYVED